MLPHFGATPLAAITQPEVQAWVTDLTARGLAPATVVKAYQLLGRTLTAAVNADMIARFPCRAVRLPKIERDEMRFITPAEVARLADAIDPRYRALVLLGAYGGLRMGELAGLRRGRVDLPCGTVDVAWIAAGANPKEVSVRAGHTSVSFTLDRYGHLFPGHDAELRDRLDAMHAQGRQAAISRRAIEPPSRDCPGALARGGSAPPSPPAPW